MFTFRVYAAFRKKNWHKGKKGKTECSNEKLNTDDPRRVSEFRIQHLTNMKQSVGPSINQSRLQTLTRAFTSITMHRAVSGKCGHSIISHTHVEWRFISGVWPSYEQRIINSNVNHLMITIRTYVYLYIREYILCLLTS